MIEYEYASEEMTKKYLASGLNNCPYCDSTDISIIDPFNVQTACIGVECYDCGGFWKEVLEVVGLMIPKPK